jgi:hypothetical protein
MEDLIMTLAEKLRKEGYEKGLQEGELKGESKGELKSARKSIYDAVDTRFDIIPIEIINIVDKITALPILENLHKKVIKVKELDEFINILHK